MTRIIAEACNNHLGDRRVMEAMIKAAKDVGVDTIKFQSYKTDKLIREWPDYDTSYLYYKQHELSEEDHRWLIKKCEEHGIGFLTTVFDLDTVDFLADLGLIEVKIASPDANNWELIDKCLNNFEHVIISTGLHSQQEVCDLISYINSRWDHKHVTLLYCVSKYPAPYYNYNLKDMKFLGGRTKNYGLSDHTVGTDVAKLAIAQGAKIIEKHFTLNKYLPGKDQYFAGTVYDFKELVKWRDMVDAVTNAPSWELDPGKISNRHYIGRWGSEENLRSADQ